MDGERDGITFPVGVEFWVRREEPWHLLDPEHGRILIAEATLPYMAAVAEPEDGMVELLLKSDQRGPGQPSTEGWTAIRREDPLHYIRQGRGLCSRGAHGNSLAFRPFPWGIVDDSQPPCPECQQLVSAEVC